MAPPSVPSVWGTTNTSMPNAQSQNFGMERRPAYAGMIVGGSSCSTASPSVSTSRPWQDVQIPPTCPATYAQDVEPQAMAPSSVLRHRRTNPLTPYKPDAWRRQLDRFGLVKRYPDLCLSIIQGFDVGIPNILKTYTPHNSSIITKYPEVYEEMMEKEFKKGRYLGPPRGLNSKHLLDLSNPRPSPLLPNQASQENTTRYMTSCTHARQTRIQCHPSTQPSIHITSHAPGEPSPQCASSSIVYHQGPKLPSEMSLRHTGLYPYIMINGQVWSCDFKEKTASQQTQTTASASPQQVGPMASSPMQVQTSYEPTALALCPSGWMTTFSSVSPNNTTASTTFGLKRSPNMGEEPTKAAAFGTGEIPCLTDVQRNTTKTWSSLYMTSPIHPHARQLTCFTHTLTQILTSSLRNLASLGNHPR